MPGRGPRGNNNGRLSASFQSFPLLPTSKLGPSGADSQVDGFVYILGPCGSLQRILLWGWEFLPLLPQPPKVFTVRFWGFISLHWNPGLGSLSCSPVVPPSISTHKCGTTQSSNHLLVMSPLCPSYLSLPLLLVWVNVSSLTAWLSDFHTVPLSGGSGFFLFLNLLFSLLLVVWGGK